MRFDVYGRMTLQITPGPRGWVVLEVSGDGKRRERRDIVLPEGLSAEEIARFLDDLFHESARPGERVRCLG